MCLKLRGFFDSWIFARRREDAKISTFVHAIAGAANRAGGPFASPLRGATREKALIYLHRMRFSHRGTGAETSVGARPAASTRGPSRKLFPLAARFFAPDPVPARRNAI
jgi:hypothetical protein